VRELSAQIGVKQACEVLNVPRSQLYRHQQPKLEPSPRPTPAHALSSDERAQVRATLNSERFMDHAPRQVYAALLDEGRYLCHWRTMYRILAAHGEVCERRLIRRHPAYKKPELLAEGANEVWSWDITWLRGTGKLEKYPLYTVLDIFSAETARKQGIQPDRLTLHADNGSPMTGKPLSQLLVDLGITRSHSRPHTSDDNPFSEAQFKTMKYRPDYPDRFASIDQARVWTRPFFQWYNHEHYHSGLNLLTPASVHYGQAEAIRAQRQHVMSAAYTAFPARFACGEPVVKGAPAAVYLNPPAEASNLA
jgi:putative transposase